MLTDFKRQLNDKGEIYFKIKVIPGAAKTELKEKMADGTIKISVAAPPERGKANQELIKFLAKEFEVGKEQIIIISGKTEKVKLIKIKL